MNALLDNDVLVKGACYGFLGELATSISDAVSDCGILGAARFVVPKVIGRQHLQRDPAIACMVFQTFLEQAQVVEPTAAEQQLAAELESVAQALALNFDTGESQLAAILVTRGVPRLLTGDKRAIVAMEHLLDAIAHLQPLVGRVHCLEQAIRRLVNSVVDIEAIRKAVCVEPRIDKALAICFSCSSAAADHAAVTAGLESYIADLRGAAGRILAT